MLTVPLYRFDQPSKLQMLDLFRHHFNVYFTEEDLRFDLPVAIGHTRTELQIGAAQNSNLYGKGILTYDRIDLKLFFFGVPLYFRNLTEVTPVGIQADILAHWGIFLDLEDVDIEIFLESKIHPQRVSIKAKETALCWVGELEGWILPVGHLGDLFNEHLISFNDRNFKRNAVLYSQDRDIHDFPKELAALLPVDYLFTTLDLDNYPIIESLRTLTGDSWTATLTDSPFNLKGARVRYNGPYNSTSALPEVIVIELSAMCQNLFGFLIIPVST